MPRLHCWFHGAMKQTLCETPGVETTVCKLFTSEFSELSGDAAKDVELENSAHRRLLQVYYRFTTESMETQRTWNKTKRENKGRSKVTRQQHYLRPFTFREMNLSHRRKRSAECNKKELFSNARVIVTVDPQ